MSITYNGLTYVEGTSGESPTTWTTPGFSTPIAAGEIILVFAGAFDDTPRYPPTDSAGNIYAIVGSSYQYYMDLACNSGNDEIFFYAFLCNNTNAYAAGMQVTVQFYGSGQGEGFPCIYAFRYSGITGAILDTVVGTHGSAYGSSLPANFTASSSGELCVALCNTYNQTFPSFTYGSGYTQRTFTTGQYNYVQDNTNVLSGSNSIGFTPTGTGGQYDSTANALFALIFKTPPVSSANPQIVLGTLYSIPSAPFPITPQGVFVKSPIVRGLSPERTLIGPPVSPSGVFIPSPIIVGARPKTPQASLSVGLPGTFVPSSIVIGPRARAPLGGLPLSPPGSFVASPIVIGAHPRAPLAGVPLSPPGAYVSSFITIGPTPNAPLNVSSINIQGTSEFFVIPTMLPTIGRRQIVAEAPSPKVLAGFIQSVPELPYWQKWASGGPPPFTDSQEEILDYIPDGTFNLYERAIAERRLKQIFREALDDEHPFTFSEQNFNNEVVPKGKTRISNERFERNVSGQARTAFRGDKPLTLVQQNIDIRNTIVEKNSVYVEAVKFVGAVVLATVIVMQIVPPKVIYRSGTPQIKPPRKRRGKRLRG